MVIGAVIAGLLIVSLFLEMLATHPRTAKERESRLPRVK
jgi:hypothetical protein